MGLGLIFNNQNHNHMSYRKGYYKKDGTYVQGHFVNKNLKSKKSKNNNKVGCLGFIFLFMTIVTMSCTEDSSCVSRNCSDFATQAEAQTSFESDRDCYSNLDRDKDGLACDN